jgi:tetratricopeptide (TPR) repeat protein
MEAEQYYSRCLEIAHRYGLNSVIGTVHFNLGNLYATLGRWSDATDHVERSLVARRRLADVSGIGASLCILAAINCHNGELDRALRRADEALSYHQDSVDRIRECKSLLIRCEVYFRRCAYKDALACAETLLSLAGRTGTGTRRRRRCVNGARSCCSLERPSKPSDRLRTLQACSSSASGLGTRLWRHC